MKILFVHNYYEYAGGEDIAVREEIDLLKRKGHRVEALFFDNKTIKKGSFYEGVKAIYSHSTKKDIESKIRSFAPDIIHVHNLFFVVSPSIFFVAQKFKIPVLVTLHNYRLICCKALLLRDGEVCELCTNKKMPIAGIKYKCYRSSYLQSTLVTAITSIHKFIGTWKNRVSHYIALTEFAKNRFLDSSLEINLNQVDVIPNFLEDQRLEVLPRENFYLFVGRLSEEKGISYLLSCFSKISDSIVIVGDGPLGEELKEKYSMYHHIQFLGLLPKNEVLKLMKRCKALIFPSTWYEGLPLTIIEAFSTATPVLASELGAMAEIIKHRANGLLFRPGNEEDLKRTIQIFNFLPDEEQQKMGNEARGRYERNYTPEVHYNLLMKVYEKAIQKYRNAN